MFEHLIFGEIPFSLLWHGPLTTAWDYWPFCVLRDRLISYIFLTLKKPMSSYSLHILCLFVFEGQEAREREKVGCYCRSQP